MAKPVWVPLMPTYQHMVCWHVPRYCFCQGRGGENRKEARRRKEEEWRRMKKGEEEKERWKYLDEAVATDNGR